MPRLEGKNIEEIVNQYASEKGVDKGEISYNIVEEKKGILGIGNKVTADVYCSEDIKQFLSDYVNEFFKGLEVEVDVKVEKDNDLYKVILNADNNAILIGRNGSTLQALNVVVKGACSNTFKRKVNVLVDINNYKEQKYEKVEMMALRVAKTVQRSKVSALLDPMPNDERKIVHQYLSNMEHIRTASEGDGYERRVRIIYDPDTKPENNEDLNKD